MEVMQIRPRPDGRVVLIAEPVGQARAIFTLHSQGPDEVVFENPPHDFPQRVIYRRAAEGRLGARIEGRRGGVLRGIDVPLRRERCDAQLQRLSPVR